MANLTMPTDADVSAFVDAIPDQRRRDDTGAAVALVREEVGADPVMWGGSIIGFGSYHYRYPTGREGDAVQIGISPRKGALTFYGLQDAPEAAALLERLGGHTLGASCLYVKDLAKVDHDVLRELVRLAWTVDRQALVDDRA